MIEKFRIVRAYQNDPGTPCNKDENYGLGFSRIQIVLKEQAYVVGEILELNDTRYQLRIMDEPTKNPSGGYVYSCVIANGDPKATVPGEYLQSTNYVSCAGSAYEERSDLER